MKTITSHSGKSRTWFLCVARFLPYYLDPSFTPKPGLCFPLALRTFPSFISLHITAPTFPDIRHHNKNGDPLS